MHILFLTDNFPPEVNAPASRTFEHCREWVADGHEVTVITCAPNFPAGKVFPGYRNKFCGTEQMAGIHVIRVWSYIAANKGVGKRVLDYVSFMLSAVMASPRVSNVDVVIGTSPQFFTVCAAYLVSLMKGAPWIFELRDIWPESIRAVGAMKQSLALDMLEKLELFLYRQSSAVVSVTNAFRQTLMRRGIDGDKIHVVTNGVDSSQFSPRPKDTDLVALHGLEGKFVAGYVGTHGMAHALETILAAAAAFKSEPDGDRYRFLLLGDGASKAALVERACREKLDNILFVDSVPKDEVARYWSLLDVSIIHLKKTELFTTVIPSKLFECMGMGIPVLHGVAGESAAIVNSEQVGIVFEPENVVDLCAGLRRLASDAVLCRKLKENGPLAAKRYNRKALAIEMLGVVEAVAGAQSAVTRRA
jgi:glycosyltransferase involved in cell wall biosynthesis